jgi:hypothetical protein
MKKRPSLRSLANSSAFSCSLDPLTSTSTSFFMPYHQNYHVQHHNALLVSEASDSPMCPYRKHFSHILALSKQLTQWMMTNFPWNINHTSPTLDHANYVYLFLSGNHCMMTAMSNHWSFKPYINQFNKMWERIYITLNTASKPFPLPASTTLCNLGHYTLPCWKDWLIIQDKGMYQNV